MKKVLIVVFLLILAGLIYLVGKEVFYITQNTRNISVNVENMNCDFNSESCEFNYQNRVYKLSFDRSPLINNVTTKMTITGEIDKLPPMWLDFKGVEVDMGFNRQKEKSRSDQIEFEFYLPSCSLKTMTWKATLFYQAEDNYQGYRYEFQTVKK